MRTSPWEKVARGAAGLLLLSALMIVSRSALAAESAGSESGGSTDSDWSHWHAGNDVKNIASLQRGARNFLNYCAGCHSLKYERYSRMAQDLEIPPDLEQKYFLPPGTHDTSYITSAMPAGDAETWFGKAPPDLSLMARERGPDYLYQFLKTFYVDPKRQTGANNMRLPSTAMPDVISALEGLKKPVYKTVGTEQAFDHFEQLAPGEMNAEEFDGFVRDTVNFLDYVGEPAQVQRRAMGVWVVLFLLLFTWLAWLLKREYCKDVH